APRAGQARRLDGEHAHAACDGLPVRVGFVERVDVLDGDPVASVESGETKAHALPVGDVGVFAVAAGAAVFSVGDEVEIAAVRAGLLVEVRPAPWIGRHALLEIRPGPVRLVV